MDVQMNLDVIGMAFGVSPIAMMLVAPDGRIRTCNAEFDALFGYGPGALTGAPVETLLPEHLRSGHVALRQAFNVIPAKRRMGAEREVKGVARDGTVLPLELALEPVVVDGGPHVIVVALDLRHRHAQRERISSVMDAASCTMVVVDAGGRIDFVNRAVTRCSATRRRNCWAVRSRISCPRICASPTRSTAAVLHCCRMCGQRGGRAP
jgi:PAS domain S-box-containing protein